MTLLLYLEMVSSLSAFTKANMLVVGLGMPHPLSSLGVPVDTPAGTMVSRAILLACSVDLPARAMICNMKQWNGAHGCLYCEEAGTTIGADHLHRYWPYKPTTPRSHASLLHNAECAIRNGTPVCAK